MQAIGQYEFGGPAVLQFVEVPQPALRPRDVLVQVRAFAINPVDMKRRSGGPAGSAVPNPPMILGWDGAGVVRALGPEAQRFALGDEVYFAGDATRAGSYAEYLAIDERIIARKPQSLSFEEAAAVPLTALTAWEAFFEQMHIPLPRDGAPHTLLIVGGAGGVGSIAIQIAKRVAQLRVIATASRPASRAHCIQLGADEVIDHTREFAPQLKALGLTGADYILNTADIANFPQLVASLNPLGVICSIVGGEAAKALDVSALFPMRGTLTFELMFTRPRFGAAPEKQGAILQRVADLLDERVLHTTVSEVMDWREIRRAHEQIDSGHTLGKLVMRVSDAAGIESGA